MDSPYTQALQEAEADLRRMENAPAGAEGWGAGEILSVVALIAALVLMLVATRWSRRLFFRRVPGREMRLIDRMALGRNANLVIVRVRGRDYWLSETPNAVTLLADWPEPGKTDLLENATGKP